MRPKKIDAKHESLTATSTRKSGQFSVLRTKLISLAGLVGQDAVNQNGEYLGVVVDLVFRWDTEEAYPPLSGVIIRLARRQVWVSAHKIKQLSPARIELATAHLDLREFRPRPGEVCLAKEVLDHQLIDIDGVRVVRASDLYVAMVSDQVRLISVDVGLRSLFRRLGPRRWRIRPTPDLVIDWATVKSFGGQITDKRDLTLTSHHNDLRRLRPGELADLLEDLGRDERQELLNVLPTDQAADALEEMEPKEVETILRESSRKEAGSYLSNMEPDEAADALRDVDNDLRQKLLNRMTKDSAAKVRAVLSHDEELAGGVMNSSLFIVSGQEIVETVRQRLQSENVDVKEIDSVVVVDSAGKFIYDLALVDLLVAPFTATLESLITPPQSLTVPAGASIKDAAVLLVESRRSSIVVVNANNKPLGRIFADDIVDALLPSYKRFRFLRFLS